MYVYDCWTQMPQQKPMALCIGKFDGVHLGHQDLLKATVQAAKKLNVTTAALVFYPHPLEYFTQQKVIMLTNLKDRCKLLKNYGVDEVFFVKFNAQLANLSANDFLQKVLLDKMQAQVIVVGDDFRFGAKKTGNVSLLKRWGNDNNIEIAAIAQRLYKNQRISTSWCRELLEKNDNLALTQLLGRQNLIIL